MTVKSEREGIDDDEPANQAGRAATAGETPGRGHAPGSARKRAKGRARRTDAAQAPRRSAPRRQRTVAGGSPAQLTDEARESARFLRIYLQDHFAGSRAGLELAKRCAQHNPDGPLGRFLSRFIDELATDRALLKQILERLGAGTNPLKQTGAWLGEKLGRLKPNGALTRYSPLSRLLELEALSLGVEGKLALWRALAEIAPLDGRLAELELKDALARGVGQRRTLEKFRLEAARELVVPR
jgi:hypothetical protein